MAALVTLDDVKDYLNETNTADDAELTDVIARASTILLNHPNYRLAAAVTSYTQDWTQGGQVLLLDHTPVVAITSVTEYAGGVGTALAAEPISTASFTAYGYRLDADAGIITRLSGGDPTCWLGNVRVVYTAGYATVPDDVRQATLDLVSHLWETQRGPADTTFGEPVTVGVSGYLLPNRVGEALAAYRRGPAVA